MDCSLLIEFLRCALPTVLWLRILVDTAYYAAMFLTTMKVTVPWFRFFSPFWFFLYFYFLINVYFQVPDSLVKTQLFLLEAGWQHSSRMSHTLSCLLYSIADGFPSWETDWRIIQQTVWGNQIFHWNHTETRRGWPCWCKTLLCAQSAFYHGLLPERQSHWHGASCFMWGPLTSERLRENRQEQTCLLRSATEVK